MPAFDREKALEVALAQIDKQYGKGSVMRLGDEQRAPIQVIPTGSIALDVALGVGGLPRGRVVEIFGPESSGKCLTADTWVWTDRGLETMAELFARCGLPTTGPSRVTDVRDLGVRVVNEHGDLEPVVALTHNGRRPVRRLRLRSGRAVTATHNHPLRVVDRHGSVVWRTVGEIRPGDRVVSALFGAVEAAGGDGLGEDEAVLLGYLVAGGVRAGLGCTTGPEAGAEFTRLARDLLGVEAVRHGDQEPDPSGTVLWERAAERYGLGHAPAVDQTVPACVRTAGHKAQRAFLSALFDAAGWTDGSSAVGLDSTSEQLAGQVQLLLHGLGIPATVFRSPNRVDDHDRWTVTVGPVSIRRFLTEVGFRSPGWHTQGAADVRPADRGAHLEEVPSPADPFGDLRAGRPAALSPASHADEEVVAVEDAGALPTFDLVLADTHSFLANGVVSHNTTVALHAVANAQAAGGIAAFIDAEHALDPDYAKALGVDTDSLLVSQPDTGEQALEIADMLVRSGALDVIVIDSVAALVPRAEIEGEMGDSHVGLQARLMSQALRKITGALNSSGTTAIFINQLREKIGVMFGNPETTTGGRALKFYASVRLDVRRIETLKDAGEAVANRTRVKVVKNKVAPPFKQAEFDIVYGQGISREGSLIDVGVEQSIIRKSGAWYTYEGDQLGQGKENARAFLRDNPDLADEIEKKIKERLNIGTFPVAGEAAAAGSSPATPDAPPPAKPAKAGRSKAVPAPVDF